MIVLNIDILYTHSRLINCHCMNVHALDLIQFSMWE